MEPTLRDLTESSDVLLDYFSTNSGVRVLVPLLFVVICRNSPTL